VEVRPVIQSFAIAAGLNVVGILMSAGFVEGPARVAVAAAFFTQLRRAT
jgi:hypothetical protein